MIGNLGNLGERVRALLTQNKIMGTNGDDRIEIGKLGDDRYEVSVNGKKKIMTRAELEGATIFGFAGDDRITVSAGVDVALKVRGGAGDDTIQNGADGVKIDGGSGRDRITDAGEGTSVARAESYERASKLGAILRGPGCVEDKIVALMSLLCHELDEAIEKKIGEIEKMQAPAGGTGQNTPGGARSSVDTEMVELNRMVTQRTQIFTMLEKMLDKYHETGNDAARSIGK